MTDTDSAKKLIYIVDDDKFISDVYTTSFKEKGADVEMFHDGDAVIKAVKKKEPDLLILDLHMPKVDGFAVLEQLKDRKNRFPIIIASNLRHQFDAQKCQELGVVEYIVKSDIQLKDFWDIVKKYL